MTDRVVPMVISREPDDRLANVRVSIGSVAGAGVYLVFRGDPVEVAELLELAAKVAGEALPAGRYADKRGRPQG